MEEWRRDRLYWVSIQSKAQGELAAGCQLCESSSSSCRVLKKLSHMALSKASPMEPAEPKKQAARGLQYSEVSRLPRWMFNLVRVHLQVAGLPQCLPTQRAPRALQRCRKGISPSRASAIPLQLSLPFPGAQTNSLFSGHLRLTPLGVGPLGYEPDDKCPSGHCRSVQCRRLGPLPALFQQHQSDQEIRLDGPPTRIWDKFGMLSGDERR